MSLPPDSVVEDIMFSGLSVRRVRSFVRRDITTVSHERLEQSRWNLPETFIIRYWWPD